jgi:uncharacterized oxidoreductase
MSQLDAGAGTVAVDPAGMGRVGRELLEQAGATPAAATIVVQHLLAASRMGVHSHGVARIPQYLQEISFGTIDPAAEPNIERTSESRLQVDGRRGFGQVVGMRMVAALGPLIEETGLAMASGRHLGHTGRVGAYPEALAEAGLVGLAACNGAPSGHWVAPFGGRDGRISTNPLAMSWPVDGEPPVVADFSTGATAEGVVRNLRDRRQEAPVGALRDADGIPSTDPKVLYAEPRGAIQPLGGALGYRGTALGLFVEVLTTMLNGDHVNDGSRKGTDMTLLGIKPQPGFGDLTRELADHLRGSPPIDEHRPVLMPGDREHAIAAANGPILVSASTWQALDHAAEAAQVEMPAMMSDPSGSPDH